MPERIRLQRTKGWRLPAGTITVARPSRWGNPYSIEEYRADYTDYTDRQLRALAVSDFRGLLEGRWDALDPPPPYYPTHDIGELAGHDLACWCPLDHPCHADVLLELANPITTENP